ncbi:MAG: hypothetical protein HQ498_12870 [Pseudohongiella sp.]|nr:hypothetical protein [Pseudohongiella sp.]
MITTDKILLRTEYINWMASFDHRYVLTISFPNRTNHYQTRRLLNLFLKHLNRKIFKNRYRRGLSFIEGFAVREPTPTEDTDHYHILIFDEGKWLPDKERFEELILKEAARFREDRRDIGDRKKCRFGRKLNYIKTVDLQDYYNIFESNLAERYTTKNFGRVHIPWDIANDSIGLLTKGDVEFGRRHFSF